MIILASTLSPVTTSPSHHTDLGLTITIENSWQLVERRFNLFTETEQCVPTGQSFIQNYEKMAIAKITVCLMQYHSLTHTLSHSHTHTVGGRTYAENHSFGNSQVIDRESK